MSSQVTDPAQLSSRWPARTRVSRLSRTELNPVSFLYRSAAIHPERVAVVHLDRRYTYAELEGRVNRLASALRSHGLGSHDRVPALCPNVPALLELHHGVPAAGRTFQVPGRDRLGSAPRDLHREGAEARAARAGVGRPHAPHQLA